LQLLQKCEQERVKCRSKKKKEKGFREKCVSKAFAKRRRPREAFVEVSEAVSLAFGAAEKRFLVIIMSE
jgi:hypothetical protein